ADPRPPAPQGPAGSSATRPAASDPEPPSPDPSQEPTVGLSLTREVVSTGEVVSVSVVLSDGHQITSLPFHLQFNPEVLAYVGAHLGPAFSGGALQPVLLASVNPSRPGDLAVGLSLVDASGSFTGSGAVLVLDFRAI